MVIKTIDATMLQKMFIAGAKSIEAKKEYINELNVFPVPDGDTGTNMALTILAAAKGVAEIQEPTMENLARIIELWTKIPASKIKAQEYQQIKGLADRLKAHIVG